jgi:hypothetical protein
MAYDPNAISDDVLRINRSGQETDWQGNVIPGGIDIPNYNPSNPMQSILGGMGGGQQSGGGGWGAPWMQGGGGPFMQLLQQLMGNMGGQRSGFAPNHSFPGGGAVAGGPGWAALNQGAINNPQPLPAWAGGGPPGGNVNPVGGGRNFSGPIQWQAGGGMGGGGGGNRMFAGGSPWFNEMQPGNWMGSALRGGGGSTYPLNPSNSPFTGTQGSNYSPMASGPFPSMQRQNSGPFPAY